jgi:plasmid stabilization system protein ParE
VLIVRAQARAEIDDAFEWYRERSPTAAADFLAVVDDALREIAEDPERFPVVHGRLRRIVLRRFPYALYYKIFPRTVSIVGVIHGHRHPDTWLSRAGP